MQSIYDKNMNIIMHNNPNIVYIMRSFISDHMGMYRFQVKKYILYV